MSSTYRQVFTTAYDLWGYGFGVPGLTQGEVDALKAEAAIERAPGIKALNRHLNLIANSPPPKCLSDATRADKPIAKDWLVKFKSYNYPNDLTPTGRAATYAWQDQIDATNAFLGKLAAYARDCGR